MQKIQLLQYFLLLNFFSGTCISQKTKPTTCGKIQIQPPFLISSNKNGSFPLNHMILCKSQKLYFRTSIGLFPISSIDYKTKTLIISHSPSSSCSSSHFVSPSLLSSGFPSPPELINSLLLFHCSNQTQPTFEFSKNCTHLPELGAFVKQEELGPLTSCLILDDLGKVKNSFHPNDMKCSHYKRVYRRSSDEYKLGTTISFDIPKHVPNICNECQKPDGHCGVGFRCICHVLECRDKVFSKGGIVTPDGKIILSLITVLAFVLSII